MSKHRVSPRPTHAEIIERNRLEAIATDPTKSEPERELARERMQQLRNAAVARMKLREIKGRDITQPTDEPKPEPVALPVKPKRDECASDADFKEKLFEYQLELSTLDIKPTLDSCFGDQEDFQLHSEIWQIGLDEAAAQKVLDSPTSNLVARQNAKRTLRQSAERIKELGADGPKPIVDKPKDSHDPNDKRPYAERSPFQTHYRKDSPEWKESRREWVNKCRFLDEAYFMSSHEPGSDAYNQEWQELCHSRGYLTSDEQWQLDNPTSYAAELNRREKEKNPEAWAAAHPEPAQPYIASPLQKQTWQAQSEKFARQRGEVIAEPTTAPTVESKRRDIAYQISLDGFTFFDDGEPCPIPLPSGISIMGASMPPGYRSGSCQIPSGLRWDAVQFVWVQK